MTHRYIKLGVTATVLAAAFAGLMWSTLRDGTEYFKHVDEVMANPQAWEGKPLQLHGYVVPGSILKRTDTLEYKFKVQNNPARAAGTSRKRHSQRVRVVRHAVEQRAVLVEKYGATHQAR